MMLRVRSEIRVHEHGTQIGPARIGERVYDLEPATMVETGARRETLKHDIFDPLRAEMIGKSSHQQPSDTTAMKGWLSCDGRDMRMWREPTREM